ncbi:hypothetical protein F5Y13DRAFT_204698 [Hypoxylon sp. FL1857]|nr:hypothetical protein F5Y13DRAFT_204698 [Hypoxylon sp. FL1857]
MFDRIDDDDDYTPGAGESKRHKSNTGGVTQRRARRPASSAGPPASPVGGPEASLRTAISTHHKDKPQASGEPPVWSNRRAALNDAVPYYRSHQGSLHTIKNVPQGMLIDAEVGSRDHFGSQVIITSVGGGREQGDKAGKMVRKESQDKAGKCFKPLAIGMEGKTPLVMVADYFHITDLWTEVAKGAHNKLIKIFMVRVEKVNLDQRSWWTPRDLSGHSAGEFKPGEYSCEACTCEACHKESKEIYRQGWACLNEKCSQFFQFAEEVDVDQLQYNDAFLRERTPYSGPQFQSALIPELPRLQGNDSGSEKVFKLGIVCPKCHGCSRRVEWDHWYCENDGCDFIYKVPLQMIPAERITEENKKMMSRKSLNKWSNPCVPRFKKVVGGHIFTTYFLRDKEDKFIGTVTRIRPHKEARVGYNDLYARMQKCDIPLKRRGARNAGARIEELTSHFSANYGAPYKFGVIVDSTTPFMLAPTPVLETQKRLTWAGHEAVKLTHELIKENRLDVRENAIPESFEPYNEQLVLGYFEEAIISPHDDGEKELGPNVASLSLGSPSVMKFQPKKKSGIEDGQSPVASIILKHGDMVVMHAGGIHKNYLHSVDSKGTHRYAMTCRYVRPETIGDAEQRDLAIENGKLPEAWSDIKYNGESDQFESRTTGQVVSIPESY